MTDKTSMMQQDVMSKLQSFEADLNASKVRLNNEKLAKENSAWLSVMADMSGKVKEAALNGREFFSVEVSELTKAQREALITYVHQANNKFKATIKHYTLRDSSEGDFLDVKIEL